MDGDALLWFTYWCQENMDADRKSFSIALVRRFGAKIEIEKKAILEDPKKEHISDVMEKIINGSEETNCEELMTLPEKFVEVVVKKKVIRGSNDNRSKGSARRTD